MVSEESEKYKVISGKKRKKGITIGLFGIDGTGKSTNAKKISSWIKENDVKCMIIPFHKWLFADMLKKKFGNYVDVRRENKSSKAYFPPKNSLPAFIKPLIALADNILMYYLCKRKYGDYDVLIFDRFICATFIKLKSLNYNVEWLRPIWGEIRPDIGIIFDIPVEISINRQNERGDPFIYNKEQLSIERDEYLKMAKKLDFPIFDTTVPFNVTFKAIKEYLGDPNNLNLPS